MKRFYVVASIPLLLAALIPIAASLWVAHRKAKDDQITYLTSLADEVLRRGVASRQQLVAALNELDRDPPPPAAKPASRACSSSWAPRSTCKAWAR